MPKGMAFGPGRRDKVPFHATLEDIYGAQAQYYDLPWLSLRNAMWRLSEFHVHGYNWCGQHAPTQPPVDCLHCTTAGAADSACTRV